MFSDNFRVNRCYLTQVNSLTLKSKFDDSIVFPHLELRVKSVEELRLLKEDLESKVLYLSEQLLNELDSREKNKRDVEVRNDFIASYIRVESKIKEDKRKRNKYATPKVITLYTLHEV